VIRFAIYSVLAICCGAAVFAFWPAVPKPLSAPSADEIRLAKLRIKRAELAQWDGWSTAIDAHGMDSIEAMEAMNAACLPEPEPINLYVLLPMGESE